MKRLKTLLIALFTAILVLLNLRLATLLFQPSPTLDEKLASLRFLQQKFHNNHDQEAQMVFPEGYFFFNAIYALNWVHAGSQIASLKAETAQEFKRAFKRLKSPAGKAPFTREQQIPYGIFYQGWLNYVLAKALEKEIVDSSEYARELSMRSALIYETFKKTQKLFLTAYPGQSWPCDSLVALASLALHDRVLRPKYNAFISQYISKLKTKNTLLAHRVNAQTNKISEGTRGSSQALILFMLSEIDLTFAKNQYKLFKKQFLTRVFGGYFLQEYADGGSGGDIDSGPVILGIGPTATIVGVGIARRFGDSTLAEALQLSIEFAGFAYSSDGRRKYLAGFFAHSRQLYSLG